MNKTRRKISKSRQKPSQFTRLQKRIRISPQTMSATPVIPTTSAAAVAAAPTPAPAPVAPTTFAPDLAPFALAPALAAPATPSASGPALDRIFHLGVLHQRQQQEYLSFLCSHVPAAVQQDQAVRERFLQEQWENELARHEAQWRTKVENLQREVAHLQAQNREVLEDNRLLREEQDRLKTRILDSQRQGARWKKEAVHVFPTLTYHFLN
ncbi:hypothetical protein FN846DRAFT_890241 [Sphaerosporella brunnea]|uniref:Uncharacterized protein n=1 Tax=Sphaerosporella brunnea TaxID=1250544 RepID=A0A5J5EWK8_9PEZI|nr:hypothetical protein FN846DRAFT_890222 [Sphaerosporella brunnea]KAA8906299.1 hypothetical protein FN846DRAFT_890241 [Sphaerosporella brunnea]